MAYGKATGGFSAVYEVVLDAIDPRFYAQSTTDISVLASSGSGTATNNGDYPAPLNGILAKLSAATGASILTFTGFGSVFTVTVPASANDRHVIMDSQSKVLSLVDNGVETLRMDLITLA
jgi:hypothetical protein